MTLKPRLIRSLVASSAQQPKPREPERRHSEPPPRRNPPPPTPPRPQRDAPNRAAPVPPPQRRLLVLPARLSSIEDRDPSSRYFTREFGSLHLRRHPRRGGLT